MFEFNKIWNNFNRPVADMHPFKAIRKDNDWIIVVNTLGLSKEDVRISVDRKKGNPYPILKIEGSKKLEALDFENSISIGIQMNFDEDEIESIKYEVKNGLTTVLVKTKENDKIGITPECISDDEPLNF